MNCECPDLSFRAEVIIYHGSMARPIISPRGVLGIVFDGDDTLWGTEGLYDEARANARRVVAESGLDGANWEKIERRIDYPAMDSNWARIRTTKAVSAVGVPGGKGQQIQGLSRRRVEQRLSPLAPLSFPA